MHQLNKIYKKIYDTNTSLWAYCLISFAIILIISSCINGLTNSLAYILKINNGPQDLKLNLTWINFVITCLLAPAIETIFVITLSSILFLFLNKNNTALLTGLVFGLIHSKIEWVSFFGIFCMFYFYSTCYLTRYKISFFNGFVASFTPHALNNFMIFIVIYTSKNFSM